MSGPDFSAIDSNAKVLELFERGQLEKLYLLPKEFGGNDAPQNIVYVPVGLGAIKGQTDNGVIAALVAERKVTRYSAVPEYSGNSFIPIAIKITASEPGNFVFDLKIWGSALR